MNRRYYFTCARLGLRDGWASPHGLGVGLTWEDQDNTGRVDKNTLYDFAVNIGQFLRSPVHHER